HFQRFFRSQDGGCPFTQRNFKPAVCAAEFVRGHLRDKPRRVGLTFLEHRDVALAFRFFTTLGSQFCLVIGLNFFHVRKHHEQNSNHRSSTQDNGRDVGASQHATPHHILI